MSGDNDKDGDGSDDGIDTNDVIGATGSGNIIARECVVEGVNDDVRGREYFCKISNTVISVSLFQLLSIEPK
jgi:hypothetical protein